MESGSGKLLTIKLRCVSFGFIILLVAILCKAFGLSIVQRDFLNKKSNAEVERHLNLGEVRGEIYDVNGERLASSLAVPSLYIDASLLQKKNIPGAVEELHKILSVDQEELKEKLSSGRKFVWLKRRLSVDEAEAVQELDIPGLRISREYRRVYPNNGMAAHFLGFVGGEGQGLEGLELSLESQLKASQQKLKVKRDNLGRIMIDNLDNGANASRGASVVLTLDRRIQYITEKALAKAVSTYGAESGMALVMRPKTGAVVAAAAWPTYDPNNYQDSTSFARRNRILTDPFEPGSTFKMFVVAAALEEGIVNPETIINAENGSFKVGNHTVRDTSKRGDLTVSEVIKYSSNIGSLKVGGLLGNDYLYNYLRRFSFGEKTGLSHLQGEAAGLMRPAKKWKVVEAANIAFGQGLSVTALQMVTAMGALANDGVLMKPYIVDRVIDNGGRIIEQYEPQILRQVVSPLTARQVAAMLRMAVQKGGTATRADVIGYPVAGKTGTAQKVVRGGRGYARDKYVASFIGFAPYHDPELSVIVVLDEPKNGYYGGAVATPAFKEIMTNALPLLDIPPTEGKGDPVWPLIQRNTPGTPGVVGRGRPNNFIKVRLHKNDRGSRGPITFASLTPEAAMAASGPKTVFADVSLNLPDDLGVMPNLNGMTMREVIDLMSAYSIELEYMGSGQVVGQTPLAGEPIGVGQLCSILFERP